MNQNQKDRDFDLSQSLSSFQKIIKQSGPAASASYGLIASILLFTYLGWYIDKLRETYPIGVIIGIVIGIVIGFYHLFKTINSINNE
tara:strand:+ start:55 stop:315 length:261 start_codon:yes stop_codon:yes gene_type:complete